MIEKILGASVAIEMVTEVFVGLPLDGNEKRARFKWIQLYIALALGWAAAFTWGLDIFATDTPTIMGMILTGAIVGAGSRIEHQAISRLIPRKKQKPQPGQGPQPEQGEEPGHDGPEPEPHTNEWLQGETEDGLG